MIKKILKDQIRKTGMVKELEINNKKFQDEINNLKEDNKKFKNKIIELTEENESLLNSLTKNSKFCLRRDLRGMSTDAGKPEILKYILDNIEKEAKILDVGFGSGTYGKLLRTFNYLNVDGLDVYDQNIKEMELDRIYDNIFIENILDFDFDYYDLIIMGDVLEHIELESAKDLLSKFIDENKCDNILVSIPYEYEQDAIYGNEHEKHLQPEVNKEFMEKHYPYLKLIDSAIMPHNGGIIATYVWNREK